MIEVRQFITRLEQGYTEAFLCRGNDDQLYVTKSKRAGCTALVHEWLCGRFGQAMGLPIPPFAMLYAAHNVAQQSASDELNALTDVPGFGSKFVTQGSDKLQVALPGLNVADVTDVPKDMRLQVLLFDWWVLNFDRTDSNPNLLWEPSGRALHVIDHNLSFGTDPVAMFWEDHIFRADGGRLFDPAFRSMQFPLMQSIIAKLPTIWDEMPPEWTESCVVGRDQVDKILRRCESDDFWCQK